MSKVYIYTRNSEINAFERGTSIETQISKSTSYAYLKDLTITEVFKEQCSGTIPFEKRDVGFELMNKVKSGDHIICSHLDRFCRNTLALLQTVNRMKRKKVFLHFCDLVSFYFPLYVVFLPEDIDNQDQVVTEDKMPMNSHAAIAKNAQNRNRRQHQMRENARLTSSSSGKPRTSTSTVADRQATMDILNDPERDSQALLSDI